MTKLQGKTALITGGNSGIGLASAKLFVAHGARVAITGRDADSLERARDELGKNVLALRSDAGKVDELKALMSHVGELYGGLDVLFLNAAGVWPLPLAHTTEEIFDATTDICFKGVFFAIQAALPWLRRGASIIVTTSIANRGGTPNFGVYAACKAAARSLVQTASLELAERGIRVNAVSPGPIDTPGFGRWDVPREFVAAARESFTQRSPSKRFGTADEVAEVALFLASDASRYVVGAELVVDGGMSLLV
jgi:NAD(P)-dependent dehydrogenase (short-subunit alcohol dehydrogenase family)